MSDSRLVIVTCPYREFPCSSFTCHDPSPEKYWVGNPHSGGLHYYPIFCKKCIDHLVANLPAELSPDGAALEARLRGEISLEYDKVMKEKLAEQETRIRSEVTSQLIEQFSKPDVTDVPVEVEVEEEQNDNAVVYRCLDCGSEFETAKKLEAHKKTHEVAAAEAPAKNKGGRPPKAKS